MDFDGINLGKTITGKPVRIYPKTLIKGMHILGSSGRGKTKHIENMIRQLIIKGQGLCLIDPHGHLYRDLVYWCSAKRLLHRSRPKKILLFNPSDTDRVFSFNPLAAGATERSYLVDKMVNCTAQVFGGQDMNVMQTLKLCLRSVYHALSENNLTLQEARHLIDPDNDQLRKYLTKSIKDPIVQQQWNSFNEMTRTQFREDFKSTRNRMMEFLASEIVRYTIGQTKKTINFRKIMDEGWTLLVNLASTDKLSDYNAQVLGTMMFNDIFTRARGRSLKLAKKHPFYIFIDECSLFINEDIGRILDEGRKFGLNVIMAHQHLSQLEDVSKKVYKAVKTDAQNKVVFGGIEPEDARVMAEQLFMGEIDLEEPVETLDKETVVEYEIIKLEGEAESEGETDTDTSQSLRGGGSGTVSHEGITTIPGGLFGEKQVSSNIGSSKNSSYQWSDSDGHSSTTTRSRTHSVFEALKPVLEKRHGSVYDLETQLYKKIVRLVNQPEQQAVIKMPDKKTAFVKVRTVKEHRPRKKDLEDFKKKCYNLSDFVLSWPDAKLNIEERERYLIEQAELEAAPPDPKSFRYPEGSRPKRKRSRKFPKKATQRLRARPEPRTFREPE